MDGILVHTYINASDDIAAWKADQCGRQAVTAQFAWEHLWDQTLYVYVETAPDPWVTITGIDKLRDGRIVLEYGRTGEIIVKEDCRVFVSKKALAVVAAFLAKNGK